MKRTAIIIVLIAVIGLGTVYLLIQKNKSDSTTANPSITTQSQKESSPDSDKTSDAPNNPSGPRTAPASAVVAATINYDGSKFSPSTTTIKAGDTLEITNSSSSAVQFDSDPHPVHTDNQELNVGEIEPGKSVKIIVNNKGTWGFHNHLDSSQTGTIIIE